MLFSVFQHVSGCSSVFHVRCSSDAQSCSDTLLDIIIRYHNMYCFFSLKIALTTETKSAVKLHKFSCTWVNVFLNTSSTIHIPQIYEKFMHMIHGTQDHEFSAPQKLIDYLLLLILCFSSSFIHVHHVGPFQLQPPSCLVYVSSIQTPLQHDQCTGLNIGEVWNPVFCDGNKNVTFKLWNTCIEIVLPWIKHFCYTSQLKYVFRLEENGSRVVGQNSLTP